ncbi:ubiquitin thioesterase OTUB1-like [Saccostrea cucullata]|uniref:ubiquitin thioesterase OTUB1-like n=1 Tax=Saccostrea cuccullata TaxID=36930 RepID=UPI002ED304B8
MMAENFHFDPEKNYDEATLAQQSEIEKEIARTQALISNRISFDEFSAEYSEEDQIYLHKIQDLKNRFSCVRKVRGDGNCFYRAFGFRYFETLLEDKSDYNRFKEVAQKTRDGLIQLGFPEFTIDDFHENFMDVVNKLETCTLDELLQTFNDQGLSDYLVVFLRLVVSGHLQKEAEFFSNFIEGERGIKEFCNQEVEFS